MSSAVKQHKIYPVESGSFNSVGSVVHFKVDRSMGKIDVANAYINHYFELTVNGAPEGALYNFTLQNNSNRVKQNAHVRHVRSECEGVGQLNDIKYVNNLDNVLSWYSDDLEKKSVDWLPNGDNAINVQGGFLNRSRSGTTPSEYKDMVLRTTLKDLRLGEAWNIGVLDLNKALDYKLYMELNKNIYDINITRRFPDSYYQDSLEFEDYNNNSGAPLNELNRVVHKSVGLFEREEDRIYAGQNILLSGTRSDTGDFLLSTTIEYVVFNREQGVLEISLQDDILKGVPLPDGDSLSELQIGFGQFREQGPGADPDGTNIFTFIYTYEGKESECPFYVGQRLDMSAISFDEADPTSLANVNQSGTVTRVEYLENEDNFQITLAWDGGANFVIPANENITAISLRERTLNSDGVTASLSLRTLEMVINSGESLPDMPDNLVWQTWEARPFNVPNNTDDYRNTFDLKPNCINALLFVNRENLAATRFNLNSFRLRIDEEDVYDRDTAVLDRDLYWDHLYKLYLNMQLPLNNLQSLSVNPADNDDTQPQQLNDAVYITLLGTPTPMTMNDKNLKVELYGENFLDNNWLLFQQVIKMN